MEEQRRKILIAAGKEMLARGIRAVTMDEIAAKLGMSKKTIYAYFKDKDEIVEAIFTAHFDEQWRGAAAEHSSSVEWLLVRMQEEVQQHHAVCPQFSEDLKRYYPTLLSDFLVRRREYAHREIGNLLMAGERDGDIRGDIDREVVVDLLTELPDMLLHNERVASLGYSPERLRFAMQELLFKGLLTEAGQQKLQEIYKQRGEKGNE